MGIPDGQFVASETISDNLRCPICYEVFEDPVSCRGKDYCQHIFCRSCLMQALEQSHTCPKCRLPICDTVVQRDMLAMNMINELRVFCPHKDSGCCWSGSLDALCGHEEVCLVRKVQELASELKVKNVEVQTLQAHVNTQKDVIEKLSFQKSTVSSCSSRSPPWRDGVADGEHSGRKRRQEVATPFERDLTLNTGTLYIQVEFNKDMWWQMPPELSAQLLDSYRAGNVQERYTWEWTSKRQKTSVHDYVVNFNTMLTKTIDTQHERRIRLVRVFDPCTYEEM